MIGKCINFYGLSAVLIDISSYARFKKSFYTKHRELGWDEKIEIKGCYSFSAKKGCEGISVEDRLQFVANLFELSKSSSKYASAKVYFTIDLFSKSISENDIYLNLIKRILKKIPKGVTSGNKNKNNNIYKLH